MVTDWTILRYQYEYGGKSLPEISAENNIVVSELEVFADTNDWTVENPPSPTPHHVLKDAPSTTPTDQYYTNVRQKLTGLMAQRALALWPKVVEIENNLFEHMQSAVNGYDPATDDAEKKLKSLMLTFTKLVENNKIYAEAIITPSLTDKKITPLLDNLGKLTEMDTVEKMLRDKGIPLPNLGVDDIPD